MKDTISRIEFRIKHGKLKTKKVKAKSDVAEKIDKMVAKVMNDTVPVEVRKKINKEVRKDFNPAEGAHNSVADMRAKISKEVGQDLGLKMT